MKLFKNSLFKVHPFFWLLIISLIVFGFGNLAVSYILAVVLHELAHSFVAKKLGYKLNKVYLLPYGAALSYDEYAFNSDDEIKIALAGPFMNVCLLIICVTLWWIEPETYIFSYNFAMSNLVTAVFNLIPAFPMDGSRIFIAIMSKYNKRKLAYKIASIINLIFSISFLILFIISLFFQMNITYGLISVFIFLGIIESKFQGKYSQMLYGFSKTRKKKVMGVKNVCIPADIPFCKIMKEINYHKLNVIYIMFPDGNVKVVYDKQFENIVEKHGLDCSFSKLYKE